MRTFFFLFRISAEWIQSNWVVCLISSRICADFILPLIGWYLAVLTVRSRRVQLIYPSRDSHTIIYSTQVPSRVSSSPSFKTLVFCRCLFHLSQSSSCEWAQICWHHDISLLQRRHGYLYVVPFSFIALVGLSWHFVFHCRSPQELSAPRQLLKWLLYMQLLNALLMDRKPLNPPLPVKPQLVQNSLGWRHSQSTDGYNQSLLTIRLTYLESWYANRETYHAEIPSRSESVRSYGSRCTHQDQGIDPLRLY